AGQVGQELELPALEQDGNDVDLHEVGGLEVALEKDQVFVVLQQICAALEHPGLVGLRSDSLPGHVRPGVASAPGLVPDDGGERSHRTDVVEEEADLHLAGLFQPDDDLSLSGETPLDVALVADEAAGDLIAHAVALVAAVLHPRADEVVPAATTPTEPH